MIDGLQHGTGRGQTLQQPDAARPLEHLRRLDARFLELWFCDLRGRRWRIAMPAKSADESLFARGLVLEGRPIGEPWNGLILLKPDPQALYLDPVSAVPTAVLFCDVEDPATRQPHPSDARIAAARAERALQASGLCASATLGAEPEFFLLSGAHPLPAVLGANGAPGGGVPAGEEEARELLCEMAAALDQAGVRTDWYRTGPSVGQGRVQMRAVRPVHMADRVILYRHVAACLARRRGKRVSFLPKPLAGPAASGMPLHFALFGDAGGNLFHDPDGWAFTSPLCRWFAGGLLRSAPALLAFCAPTMNSYRRLVAGTGAPVEAVLSCVRSTAACRIPMRTQAPDARRIKFCLPDPSANPYLAAAAGILAGLRGMRERIEPLIEGETGARLPHSLEEALQALQDDFAFLKTHEAFSDELIQRWVADRWRSQVLPIRSVPHPAELELE